MHHLADHLHADLLGDAPGGDVDRQDHREDLVQLQLRGELQRRRGGLAGEALAVALGVGRVLPELTRHATRWPYVVLGVGFALYGIAMFLLGTRRMGVFDRKVWKTTEHSAEDRMLVAFMTAGVILGIGTLALIAIR